jgi:hypothetical protein
VTLELIPEAVIIVVELREALPSGNLAPPLNSHDLCQNFLSISDAGTAIPGLISGQVIL